MLEVAKHMSRGRDLIRGARSQQLPVLGIEKETTGGCAWPDVWDREKQLGSLWSDLSSDIYLICSNTDYGL